MNKQEFIEWLQTLDDGEIQVFDPDTNEWQAVTGAVHGKGVIQLYCDSNNIGEDQ